MYIKIKRILLLGIICIFAMIFMPNESQAATYKDAETGITWYYSTSSGYAYNVYVSSYTTLPETLVIPDKMAGSYPVRGIRGSNTSTSTSTSYRYNILSTNTANTTVTSVVLPATLQSIGVNTFANFKGLTSIVIPDSVTSIGAYSFYYCQALKELTMPISSGIYTYTSTGSSYTQRAAFYQCRAISKITLTKGTAVAIPTYTSSTCRYLPWYTTGTNLEIVLPEGITGIGDYAFAYASYLNTINVPETVITIGNSAFQSCTKLNGITLPENLTSLGVSAFYSCSSLEAIKIPEKITTINNSLFASCSKLKTIEIPETVTTIGSSSFNGCTSWAVENLKLPTSLTSLGTSAFYNCQKLTGTLEFPDTFTEVPQSCFYNTGFSEIILPETVTTIKSAAFQRCVKLTSIDLPTNLVVIEAQAFESCTGLTGDLSFPDTVTTIGNYAFRNCTGFNGKLTLGANLSSIGSNVFFGCTEFKEAEIKSGVITNVADSMFSNFRNLEKVILGDSVTSIGSNAFQSCIALKEIPMNDNITSIGTYAFQGCTGISTLKLGKSVSSIGEYAFKNCSGIVGDVTFPDSLTNIGANAFNGCTGINGTVTIGSGISVINKFTFYGCPNIGKFVIPNSVKEVQKFSLWGISDVYYLGTEDEVKFSDAAGGSNEIFVHYKNCTHKLNIDVPEGYEIINSETGDVLTTSEYTCETALKLAVRAKNRTTDSDLSVVVSKQGKYKNSENVEEKFALSAFNGYEIPTFNRDYTIMIKDVSVVTDLSLRNYIYQRNYNNSSPARVPIAENESGIISYKHTKLPVEVKTGDLITFKVRVYNEGDKEGLINEITEYLPEGLVLANSETNRKYGWIEGENGKVSTRYFENKPFDAYSGDGSVPYEEISLICKVTSLGIPNADQRLVIIGEITEGVTKDTDSTYGQITARVDSTYKNEEAYASTTDSYVKSDDDDTDFENVVIKPSMPVEYTIKVTKIDSETQALLSGAVFNLKDTEGNIVSTATTNEEGVLTFGLITSYGEGTDIFYIEEALAPEGYRLTEKETIEVNVTKTIIDETLGTYSLKVICQTLNYSTDITRYDYNPIATPEHLAKIGSGEWIEYEGYKYQFTDTANYRLVNDIDLDGIIWTPIDKKITGIFDGNNHSIKNLTIASNDLYTYSEVGLFRSFSGIVSGLNMENVNIHVPGMVVPDEENGIELDTISGYTCVGGFAGFMEKGTVKSCSISGNIYSGCNNVGGFVGHSAENNIIKFQNCTNSAKITVSCEIISNYDLDDHLYNVGGLIGCAIGSLSVNDCINEGSIDGNGSNVGGLVGFVNSTGYEEVAIKAEYSDDDKTIGLVIGNTRTTGKYDIVLENRDVETLGFISGAKYTVYNSKLEEMSGFEKIQLQEGKLKVATVDIDYVGTDTYYIKEQTPAPGYSRLKSYVKLVVSREWNSETEKFEVTANADNIVDDKISEEPKQENTYKPLESTTGEVFAGITEEVIGFYNDKVSIVDCSNKANILGYMNAAGLVGTAYCNVQIDQCNNSGNITAVGYGKAGGLIAEVRKQSDDNFVEIKNSTNEGDILSSGSTGSSSGIIAHVYSNIKISNCLNKGIITAGAQSSAAGIIADLAGTAEIRECTNEEDIITYSSNEYGDVNCIAGGIVGKHMSYKWATTPVDKEASNIYIYDCLNTGNITSYCHLGGIVGMTGGKSIVIQNTINRDNTIHSYCGDNGGMVGFSSVNNLEIINCVTKNTEFSQVIGGNRTYGFTGGMVGDVCAWNCGDETYNKFVNIKNCEVLDCLITSVNKEPAGILGGGYNGDKSRTGVISISNCNVERCDIENRDAAGTYASSAGILGVLYEANTISISDCNVKECNISTLQGTTTGYDANVGGIFAMIWYSKNIYVTNCDVEDCILNNTAVNDGCANTAGIAAAYGCDNPVYIIDCDVTNSELNALSGNLAGTLGMSYSSPTVIKDCDNKGLILFSTSTTGSNTCTGGVVANSFQQVTLENCSFTGSDNAKAVIYGRGRNVAGLVANQLYGDTVTIKNSIVKDVVIESEGCDYYQNSRIDSVSGILGNTGAAVQITDCVVDNVDIEGIVGNATAVLSDAYQSSTENIFANITVKNSKIKNHMTYARGNANSTASAISGYVGAKSNYTNCKVENCEIIGSGCATGGLVAVAQYGGTFTNCSIKDSKVTKLPGGYTTNTTSSIGGIVGVTINETNMIECSVDNVEISSDTYSTGGMAGILVVANEFKNNTVKDLKITSTGEMNVNSNGSIGGFVADITSSKADGIQFTNCDIINFTAESGSNHIGGILGTSMEPITFDGCDVDNFQAKYTNTIINANTGTIPCTRCIGGIIAVGTYDEKTINNCTVKNSTLTATEGLNANSSLGSFVGFGTEISFSNCDAINNKIINETPVGMSGGILGASQSTRTLDTATGLWKETYSLINYDDVQVKDCTISSNGAAGGVHGYGVANVTNSGVNNCTIEDKTANSNGVGGIVGMSLSIEDSSIKNTSVVDSKIIGKDYAGGISGFTSGIIDNCTVSNTTITTDSTINGAGGIAGMIYDTSNTISNSTVSGTDVTSAYYTGGIVGFTEGNLTDNKVNEESTITTTSSNYSAGGILGLTSNSSGEITNCDVDKVTVKSVNGFAGGIAGFANNIISGSDVNNATIIATGDTPTNIGGIIGQASSETGTTTVVTTSTIANTNLQTAGTAGKVAGAGLADETGCTVDDETVFITSPVSSMNFGTSESEDLAEEEIKNLTENVEEEIETENTIEEVVEDKTEEIKTENTIEEPVKDKTEEIKTENTTEEVEEEKTEETKTENTTEEVVEEKTEETKTENTTEEVVEDKTEEIETEATTEGIIEDKKEEAIVPKEEEEVVEESEESPNPNGDDELSESTEKAIIKEDEESEEIVSEDETTESTSI